MYSCMYYYAYYRVATLARVVLATRVVWILYPYYMQDSGTICSGDRVMYYPARVRRRKTRFVARNTVPFPKVAVDCNASTVEEAFYRTGLVCRTTILL